MSDSERSAALLDQMMRTSPFVCFSWTTQVQIDALIRLGDELIQVMDAMRIEERTIDSSQFSRAHGLAWLWVLGTYEVLRTLSQHATALSSPMRIRTRSLKKRFSKIRVPFAKQEFEGKRDVLVPDAFSLRGLGESLDDLHFMIEDSHYSIRELVSKFQEYVRSTTASDFTFSFKIS